MTIGEYNSYKSIFSAAFRFVNGLGTFIGIFLDGQGIRLDVDDNEAPIGLLQGKVIDQKLSALLLLFSLEAENETIMKSKWKVREKLSAMKN